MRIYEETLIKISADEISAPKEIRFQTDSTTEDTSTFNEIQTLDAIFPVGTTVVSMGSIAAAKFLYIKPTLTCTAVISGEQLVLRAGKENKMWVDFTTLSIIEATANNFISLVIAGD